MPKDTTAQIMVERITNNNHYLQIVRPLIVINQDGVSFKNWQDICEL